MDRINKFLLMIIAMVVIMIAAVGIDRGLGYYDARKWERERVQRYEQARADVADMELEISELSKDPQAIEAFIEENREYFDEVVDVAAFEQSTQGTSGNAMEDVSGNGAPDISGNQMPHIFGGAGSASGNEMATVSGEGNGSVSGNRIATVSGEGMPGVSGNMQGEVSGNMAERGETVSGNTLLEKRKIRSSYMETQIQNKVDQAVIADRTYDFSDISIACLGDSITEASNLDSMEGYRQYSYPTRLGEILGAKSVLNLGIGGSSIGRYWDKPFVERYQEIPRDTDLIIVMGGTNDGFCLNQEDLGTLEERKADTFIGDLDELMRGLKQDYPDAVIVFATPLPNVLHDVLRKERDYLLPQVALVNVIRTLAAEYEIPVIDLYNSNLLDTHDAAVIYNYMPDGVHCNPDGYMVLAEHFAAELIRIYESGEHINE